MLLRSNTYRFLLLINLFVALNLSAKTDQTPNTQASQDKKKNTYAKKTAKKSHANLVTEIHNQLELTAQLNSHKAVILEIYQTGCGSCVFFEKKYEKLAAQYPQVTFLKIDGNKNPEVRKAYNVNAYPTFNFILNQKSVITPVVGSHRDLIEKNLIELTKQANNPVQTKTTSNPSQTIKELGSLSELEALIKSSDKPVVVDYHAERWCGPCKFFGPLFNELAEAHSDIAVFVKINTDLDQNQAVAQKHKITSFPTTMIFKDKKVDQAHAKVSGANKDGVEQAILQAANTKK